VRKSTVHHGDDLQTGFRGFEITVFEKSVEKMKNDLKEISMRFGIEFEKI
jgi:hypothetical protein